MSLKTDITIEGLNELRADIEAAGGNSDRLVMSALTNSTTRTQSEIRKRARHRTGTLQRSVLGEITFPSAEVAVHEKYGIFWEEGTGIYGPKGEPIRPKQAKALAFTKGGQLIFAKSVKGMRAQPFFKPGVEAARPYVRSTFNQVIDILTRGLAGKGF